MVLRRIKVKEWISQYNDELEKKLISINIDEPSINEGYIQINNIRYN